jgi:hypothetical protein
MIQNVGGVDRIARAAAGAAALVLAITVLGALEGNLWGVFVGVAGVVLIGTAAFRFCPAYLPIRFSTCKAGTR